VTAHPVRIPTPETSYVFTLPSTAEDDAVDAVADVEDATPRRDSAEETHVGARARRETARDMLNACEYLRQILSSYVRLSS
jgi:hypothetical protein